MKFLRLVVPFFLITLLLVTSRLMVSAAPVAYSSTFNVDVAVDTHDAAPGNGICADANGDCSLRAAIEESNALSGTDLITLPAGIITYTLSLEDPRAQLEITSDLTLQGAGAANSVIDGNQLDRVIEIRSSSVVINDVTITGGRAPDGPDGAPIQDYYGAPGGDGGGIQTTYSNLELNRVFVTKNRTGDGGDNYIINGDGEQVQLSCPGRGGNGTGIAAKGGLLVLNETTVYDNQGGVGGNQRGGGSFGSSYRPGARGVGGVVYVIHASIVNGSSFQGAMHNGGIRMSNSTISHNPGGFFYDITTYNPETGCVPRQPDNLDPYDNVQSMPTTPFGEPINYFENLITLYIENSTIVNNFDAFGSQDNVRTFRHFIPTQQHYAHDIELILSNSIVSQDCFWAEVIGEDGEFDSLTKSLGHNLFLTPEDSGCVILSEPSTPRSVATDIYADDLGVSYVPRDDGGPVPTHWLYVGSPALDAGNCPNVTTDQRGRPRPVDQPYVTNVVNGCDIGAVEIEEVTGINYSHRGVETSSVSPIVFIVIVTLMAITAIAMSRRFFSSPIQTD